MWLTRNRKEKILAEEELELEWEEDVDAAIKKSISRVFTS